MEDDDDSSSSSSSIGADDVDDEESTFAVFVVDDDIRAIKQRRLVAVFELIRPLKLVLAGRNKHL